MRQSILIVVFGVVVASLAVTASFAGPRGGMYSGVPYGRPIGRLTMPYNDHEKMVICTNRSVPPDWIIVGVRNSSGCSGLGSNSWVIQRLPTYPGADIIICANQPVPPGWAIVERVKNAYCGVGVGGLRIRKM